MTTSSGSLPTVRIGNAQGFWGDRPDAARTLVEQVPDLDYLTLDYLAELSLSIMAAQKASRPDGGFARDFLDVVRDLCPVWTAGRKLKVITNAGGLDPMACARATADILSHAGLAERVHVGLVEGDNCLSFLRAATPTDTWARHAETNEWLGERATLLATANAYIGAAGVVDALRAGADIVVTGRVADPSMVVAAAMDRFDWSSTDYDRLAQATVAGHLLECGTQATGGLATNWRAVPDPASLGYPYVEIAADGTFSITKPPATGGLVSVPTVTEQLLYELGDPGRYLSPDVIVSMLSLTLEQEGADRVRVTGAKGSAPPPTYKVSATYPDGFRVATTLMVVGHDAVGKARQAGAMILERMRLANFAPRESLVEVIGAGDLVRGVLPPVRSDELVEVTLRVAIADDRRSVVDRFCREIAPLVTSGPPGITGYADGRPHPRAVYQYWPCLLPRDRLRVTGRLLSANLRADQN